MMLTADLVARAVIAACQSLGDDPVIAMKPSCLLDRRSAIAAGSALATALDLPLKVVAATLQTRDTTITHARKRNSPEFQTAEAAALRALNYAGWRPENAASVAAPADPPSPPPPAVVEIASETIARPEPVEKTRAPRRPRASSGRDPMTWRDLKPVNSNILRWSKQFIEAGWHVREIARLFDVFPAELQRELGLVRAKAA